ncbi:hypothetical protein niasHT_007290 [Heterodera trifolii]|uniref:Uncharacterized protein n=1 Tax=Heterodera trifolii TaxID=157864 RepID=A0ABD2LMU2_9BILA
MSMSGPAIDQSEKNRKLLQDLQKTKQQMMMRGASAVSRSSQPPLLASASSSSSLSSLQQASTDGTQGTSATTGQQQHGTLANKSNTLLAMEMIQKSSIIFYPTNSNYGNQLLPGFPRFLAD